MRRIAPAEVADPFGEMNTTPLIDVLLVLLVMLIITIPPQTHAVKLDLPSGPPPKVPILPHSNLLTIDAKGVLRWNGSVIDREDLRTELAASRQMAPAPELHLRPDPDAHHGDVDELLAIIKREQISRFGLVGNEQYLHVF
jgi:biopolymer transport protein ExbD